MYVDNNLLVSGSVGATGALTAQNVFSAGTSVLSTNTIDLLQARDLGEGTNLYGRWEWLTAAVGGTSIEMQVIVADDAALSTNVTVVGTTGAVPVASLVIGSRWAAQINMRLGLKGQRYMGCRYVNVGTTTAGAVMGDIGLDVTEGNKFYPVGFSIL